MDLGIVSIVIATGVGMLQLLNYLNTRSAREEVSLDKFAKAEAVANEITGIKASLSKLHEKFEYHNEKIAELRTQNAVCINQHENTSEDMQHQLEALEKIVNKLEDLK
jgi:chromosome segregation ATPase